MKPRISGVFCFAAFAKPQALANVVKQKKNEHSERLHVFAGSPIRDQ